MYKEWAARQTTYLLARTSPHPHTHKHTHTRVSLGTLTSARLPLSEEVQALATPVSRRPSPSSSSELGLLNEPNDV